MSGEDLRELERDVEAARARLTDDLSVLRSSQTYSDFTDNLKQAAVDTKNSIIEDARARTRSAVDEVLDKVKARAAANPAAVLLIGAGLAWHLIRRPPIVAALVGGGLYGLFRSQPQHSHLDDRRYMDEARANLKTQASDAARAAGELAREKAAELTDAAAQAGRQAAEAVRSKAAEWTGGSNGSVGGRRIDRPSAYAADEELYGRSRYADAYYDEVGAGEYAGGSRNGSSNRDRLLLGAAGVAVAAAVALAYQRGQDQRPDMTAP